MRSLLEVPVCGAPRDMGLDQARALRAELRSACRSGAGCRAGDDRAGLRVLRQHVPQQAERLEGIAWGAGANLRRLYGRAQRTDPRAFVRSPIEALFLRRSHPDAGFGSVEIVPRGGALPLLGLNEAGLYGLVQGCASDGCVPSALWLLPEALARFERASAARDWCSRRPVGSEVALRFFDRASRDAAPRVRSASGCFGFDGEALVFLPEDAPAVRYVPDS